MSRLILFAAFMLLASLVALPAAPKGDEPFVVVVDAGHGGHDAGALGVTTNEKSINLAVAAALRDRLAEEAPGIKVVMTRSTDRFLSLSERARVANRSGGDLFVSIHTNSVDKKNPRRKSIAGTSVYALGLDSRYSQENLDVAMRENGVITLEPDFSTTYEGFDPSSAESYIIFEMDTDLHRDQSISAAQAVQQRLVASAGRADRGVRQAHFMVLRMTAMPAILVELDFICNPDSERFMASEKGQAKLARAIADGIIEYSDGVMRDRARIAGRPVSGKKEVREGKNKEIRDKKIKEDKEGKIKENREKAGHSSDASAPVSPAATSSNPVELADNTGDVVFRIQFLSSPRKLHDGDKRLRGLPDGPVCYYLHGGMVKYTFGRFTSQKEAEQCLKRVRKMFDDAFIIRTRGSSRL